MHPEESFYNKVGRWIPAYSLGRAIVNKVQGNEDIADRSFKNALIPGRVVGEAASEVKDRTIENVTNTFDTWADAKKKSVATWVKDTQSNCKAALPYVTAGIAAAGVLFGGLAYWRRQAAKKAKELDEDRYLDKVFTRLNPTLRELLPSNGREGLTLRRVGPSRETSTQSPHTCPAENNHDANLAQMLSHEGYEGLVRRRTTPSAATPSNHVVQVHVQAKNGYGDYLIVVDFSVILILVCAAAIAFGLLRQ